MLECQFDYWLRVFDLFDSKGPLKSGQKSFTRKQIAGIREISHDWSRWRCYILPCKTTIVASRWVCVKKTKRDRKPWLTSSMWKCRRGRSWLVNERWGSERVKIFRIDKLIKYQYWLSSYSRRNPKLTSITFVRSKHWL